MYVRYATPSTEVTDDVFAIDTLTQYSPLAEAASAFIFMLFPVDDVAVKPYSTTVQPAGKKNLQLNAAVFLVSVELAYEPVIPIEAGCLATVIT